MYLLQKYSHRELVIEPISMQSGPNGTRAQKRLRYLLGQSIWKHLGTSFWWLVTPITSSFLSHFRIRGIFGGIFRRNFGRNSAAIFKAFFSIFGAGACAAPKIGKNAKFYGRASHPFRRASHPFRRNSVKFP